MFPGQCGNTAFFFKSQPDQFHFEFRGIVFPGKSFFSAHEVSTCKISGCLSYRILDSGPDGTQTTLTFTELVARVRTLLRRARSQAATVCTIADMTVDMVRRTVIRSGKKIHLTGKEYVLLELLLQRTGEVLPRSLISSLVWNMNFDSDTNVIDVAVRRLRSKIDDDFEPKLIHTVRGAGYVLEIREE